MIATIRSAITSTINTSAVVRSSSSPVVDGDPGEDAANNSEEQNPEVSAVRHHSLAPHRADIGRPRWRLQLAPLAPRGNDALEFPGLGRDQWVGESAALLNRHPLLACVCFLYRSISFGFLIWRPLRSIHHMILRFLANRGFMRSSGERLAAQPSDRPSTLRRESRSTCPPERAHGSRTAGRSWP